MLAALIVIAAMASPTFGTAARLPEDPNCAQVLEIVNRLHPAVVEGRVEVCGCARIPGYRTKLVVRKGDRPVEAFVGPEGAHIQIVVEALDGETVDVVPEETDPARAAAAALAPARLVRIYLDEAGRSMDLVVVDGDLDRARGPGSQHLQLAATLTGYTLHVLSETEDVKTRETARAAFERIPGISPDQATALVQWGFLDLQTVADADALELAQILGIAADEVHRIQAAAALLPPP